MIESVLAHAGARAHWLHSDDIPLLEDLGGVAARRDEAPALLYGGWNAALAAGSRAAGARVAFDGNGGDQLFGPSTTQLAELLVSGHWYALAREWWLRRAAGLRQLWRWTAGPVLLTLPHYRDWPLAPWIRADFAQRERLVEFERAHLPRQGLRVARRDREWLLTAPYIAWAMSRIAELALRQGVELRSPLLDRRVIAFAFARPWHERGRRWETKRLLRAAMRDLLPPALLAPRGRRTGVTTGYSRGWMQRRYPELFAQLWREPLELERLGIVDGRALRRAADTVFASGTDGWIRINLFHVLEVEHWLRARASRENTAAPSRAAVPRDRAEWFALQRSHVFHPSAGG
jgi:asparagine synthetase B (glutamine-hydrolysing)